MERDHNITMVRVTRSINPMIRNLLILNTRGSTVILQKGFDFLLSSKSGGL